MKKSKIQSLQPLVDLLGAVAATDLQGRELVIDDAVERSVKLVESLRKSKGKCIMIGNGGSAAIASHISVDLWKNGGVRAVAFNDASLLTCIANDCGYQNVFGKPVEMFADEGDILVAISSSGKSENILNGVRMARSRRCRAVTLSGFDGGNPLRSLGEINFYVPSHSYGHVEICHLALCHAIVDLTVRNSCA